MRFNRYQGALVFLGLAVKLALIMLVSPQPVVEWYAPFLKLSTESFGLNPWGAWLESGGSQVAFPYGYVMWLVLLPLTAVGELLNFPEQVGYGLTLLAVDGWVFVMLSRLFPAKVARLVVFYWLSPIVIVASYLLGYNDLIPVSFLVLSLYYLREARMFFAGVALMAAVSAKLSMIISLPFFLIYFYNNRMISQFFGEFAKGVVIGGVILVGSLALSPAGISMLVGNPEVFKVYQLSVMLDNSASVFLVPLVYILMLYATWRVRRLNFELFNTMFGLAFLLVALGTSASLGWYIWVVPLLVTYLMIGDRFAMALVTGFSVLIAALGGIEFLQQHAGTELKSVSSEQLSHISSLIVTLLVATGVIIAIRIRRESVRRNDYFRLSRKPFVLGVAGDSGSGKDTYADAITGLFGEHSVTALSGDDYHLWDRQKPMWQVMTHLNPMANDLESFAHDVVDLTDGKSIITRHYDHSTGKMTKPFKVKSNDFIVVSGLHALYLPILRQCYNLSVYLDIDEELRQHFKLQRDVKVRGHTAEKVLSSIEKRKPDSEQFIRPQKENADLVLSLKPVNKRMIKEYDGEHPLRLKLAVGSRHGLSELSLTRVLIGVCGLHVDMVTSDDSSLIELTIEGETSAEDIEMAAHIICPRVFEFLDITPQWQDGVLGLMQLVTLSHVNQAFTKRFI